MADHTYALFYFISPNDSYDSKFTFEFVQVKLQVSSPTKTPLLPARAITTTTVYTFTNRAVLQTKQTNKQTIHHPPVALHSSSRNSSSSPHLQLYSTPSIKNPFSHIHSQYTYIYEPGRLTPIHKNDARSEDAKECRNRDFFALRIA
ncbi:hypothetical protein A7U60_g2963 [Sanghuangporus baumii]|uniref:Uncharacterized protein n=1 Tax=Sanghuangporus baumii TaxID=108892 RepID=A0A9Q5N7I4_SANBA|nr:hypothetical protein A7U60_g2963 [Sanghuangporus baumii]